MKYAFLSGIFAILLLAPFNVLAANCASPTGSEGQVRYDSTTKLLYYCDGTGWKSASGTTRGAQIRVQTGVAQAPFSAPGVSLGSLSNSTYATVPMQTSAFDNGGWVNSGGYFVVPSGITKVRVLANYACDIQMTTANTYMSAYISKNDGHVASAPLQSTPGYISTSVYVGAIHFFGSIQTGTVSVTAGDTIKLKVQQANPSAISQVTSCRDHWTWMEIQAVE